MSFTQTHLIGRRGHDDMPHHIRVLQPQGYQQGSRKGPVAQRFVGSSRSDVLCQICWVKDQALIQGVQQQALCCCCCPGLSSRGQRDSTAANCSSALAASSWHVCCTSRAPCHARHLSGAGQGGAGQGGAGQGGVGGRAGQGRASGKWCAKVKPGVCAESRGGITKGAAACACSAEHSCCTHTVAILKQVATAFTRHGKDPVAARSPCAHHNFWKLCSTVKSCTTGLL